MVLLGIYTLAIVIYTLSAWMSYSSTAKAAAWYFPAGVLLSVIANTAWLYVARNTAKPEDILFRGLIWDSIITLCFVIAPIFFFQMQLTRMQILGASLILVGLFVAKF